MNENFFYGEERIDVVKSYVYLGVNFTNTAIFEKNAREVAAKAGIATSSTLSLIKNVKLRSWSKIISLFDALVVSIVAHASIVWAPRYSSIIEKIQCQFFKKLLSLPICTPNYAVRIEIGRSPIMLTVLKLILRWLTKLLNMNSKRYPLICFQKLYEDSKTSACDMKYNWAFMIREVFFCPIDEMDLWNDIAQILSPGKVDYILEKFKVHLYNEDMKSLANSTSLILYPGLFVSESSQEYLSFNLDLSTKKIFAQLRLLNKYNTRFINRKKIYKFSDNHISCEYCGVDFINILHLFLECIRYEELRKTVWIHRAEGSGFKDIFMSIINYPNESNLRKVVCYMLSVLERGLLEDIIEATVL